MKPLLVFLATKAVTGPNYTVWAQRHLNINNYVGIKAANKRRITRRKVYQKEK